MRGDLRVHVDQLWYRQGWGVWFYEPHRRTPSTSLHYRWDGVEWQAEELGEGVAAPDPSLFLPGDSLKLLVDAATEKLPADGAMASHLRDAQGTRDRLLAMIEKRGLR
jgi:hypothetical protein